MLRRLTCCVIVIAAACSTARVSSTTRHDPTVAYPFTVVTVARTDVAGCMATLLEQGGYGKMPFERAAFLVLRDDGSFACRTWGPTADYRSAQWKGAAPDGTAAVLHTHPAAQPGPSAGDVRLAQRLGIPVFVITPSAIVMASPAAGMVVEFTPPDERQPRRVGANRVR